MIFFGFFGKKTVFRRNTPRQISTQRTFSPSNKSPKDKNKKKKRTFRTPQRTSVTPTKTALHTHHTQHYYILNTPSLQT